MDHGTGAFCHSYFLPLFLIMFAAFKLRCRGAKKKKLFLFASIAGNLTILGFFKYFTHLNKMLS
jgi:hypothetical protein